ncbi:MAG: M3 family metallopeptidase [Gammaproteobacteria bacterium]|nr:M3 family metallopeptidase [Gammaproteobacteria bacterium]
MDRRNFFAVASAATVIAATTSDTLLANTSDNPFLKAWTLPNGAPPFDQIKEEHFLPAFEAGIAERRAEIAAITAQRAAATFANTIDQLESGGDVLNRVQAVFFNMSSANTNADIQRIQREISPKLAAFRNDVYLDANLFARIEKIHEGRKSLKAEQRRVIEKYYDDFVRAGAKLSEAQKNRVREIDQRMSMLSVQFQQNQLADSNAFSLELKTDADRAGLPAFALAAAQQAGKDVGQEGKYLITLSRSSVETFLQLGENRELREKAFNAWAARGANGNQWDNRKIIGEMVALRAERAKLLGFETHADFVLADRMAKTPGAARDLIERVWKPARERALQERADMQALIDTEGGNFKLQGWDWRYYAEKVRKLRFDLDQDQIKPYFQLDKMIEAQFFVANRLWGLTFAARADLPVYHPDVRIWEVRERDGEFIGLFYGDFYARPSKQSGAWMSSYRNQRKIGGARTPVVVNVCNFNKPAAGQPALLSYDDAETLFHEFGHALHGLLSDVAYPRVAGTSVPTDFVEFPAQVYEHWLGEPAVLQRFAAHYETGEPIPQALLDRLMAARNFNQGFATVEFLASAFVDLDAHMMTNVDAATFDIDAVERDSLARLQMPAEIVCRHRPTHFGHIFSGGYSAGYYSYMWSEVLDADGFQAFKEAGDIFDPATAARLREHVYSAGGTREPMDLYVAFRGREPDVQALLRNRGFA